MPSIPWSPERPVTSTFVNPDSRGSLLARRSKASGEIVLSTRKSRSCQSSSSIPSSLASLATLTTRPSASIFRCATIAALTMVSSADAPASVTLQTPRPLFSRNPARLSPVRAQASRYSNSDRPDVPCGCAVTRSGTSKISINFVTCSEIVADIPVSRRAISAGHTISMCVGTRANQIVEYITPARP